MLASPEFSPKRICIIKPSALGDVLQALPILAPLRQRFPYAQISWVINANLANLLEDHPHIDERIPFHRHGGAVDLWRLMRKLHQSDFDLVIDLQGLLRTGLMTAATRASHRWGLETAREGSGVFCTALLPDTGHDVPAWQRYWRVAEAILPNHPRGNAELALTSYDRAVLFDQLASLPRPWLAVCPGARWETKRWPAEKFARIALRAHRELAASPILLGSPDERELCDNIANTLSQHISAHGFAHLGGKTNLRSLAAILEASDWALTNDSGPLHLADAMGTPAVGLFTCTSPVRSGPPPHRHELITTRLDCAAGYHKKCPLAGDRHLACFQELDEERVWRGLVRLVEKSHRAAG